MRLAVGFALMVGDEAIVIVPAPAKVDVLGPRNIAVDNAIFVVARTGLECA
jgi:hypothetical protein